jgi:hypothetical protein
MKKAKRANLGITFSSPPGRGYMNPNQNITGMIPDLLIQNAQKLLFWL